jgi:hypothetical protein
MRGSWGSYDLARPVFETVGLNPLGRDVHRSRPSCSLAAPAAVARMCETLIAEVAGSSEIFIMYTPLARA